MNRGMEYGDVALGVEAALPAFPPDRRPGFGHTRLVRTSCLVRTSLMRRTLIWLSTVLKRWS